MITPLPVTNLKPGSASRPFPGIEAAVFDEAGQPVKTGEEGFLVLKKPWPAMLRTIYGDPDRYVDQYWSKYPGAYGIAPEVIQEPFTIVLWGVTNKSLADWSAVQDVGDPDSITELKGFAGSPGIVEGKARVCRTVADVGELKEGEILVAPTTSPSWAPAFAKIRACVTDVGGVMSHAAIVCREYCMPAVVGTGSATKIIQTGMTVRVDGSTGAVTIAR